MRKEYDVMFPDCLPFPEELDQLLSADFWQ
jgi:hypothetical protein